MRIAANARTWRPYVGSRVARDFAQLAAQRAKTGATAAGTSSGNGGGSTLGGGSLIQASGSAQGQGGSSSAPAKEHSDSAYARQGMGTTPMTLSDRRDPNARLVTGGRIDELFDEAWFAQPASSSVRVKREGPMLRIAVPGDWGEWIFDQITGEDGRKYWACLDGAAPFYKDAPDKYHPDVGTTMGTILLPSEEFPLVNVREDGPEGKKRTGDISILAPIIWHKKRHFAGNEIGDGGAVLVRKKTPAQEAGVSAAAAAAAAIAGAISSISSTVTSTFGGTPTVPVPVPPPTLPSTPNGITPEDAAKDRHVARSALEELELEFIGGNVEQVPFIEGPGWTPCVIFWHEQLQCDPEGNHLLDTNKTAPGLGDLTTANMVEWLDYNPGAITFSGDDCVLEPLTVMQRVNLRYLSYMCGIAANTEIAERMSQAILTVDENARRAHRVAVGASLCACQIKQAFIDDRGFAADYPMIVKKLAQIGCPCGCKGVALGKKPEPVLTDEQPAPGGGGAGGAPGVGGAPSGYVPPGAPPGWTVGSRTFTSGGAPPPAGAITGGSTPVPPIAGGGTSTFWYTATSYGYTYTPPGGTVPGGLTPSDIRLKNNLQRLGTRNGFTLWQWEWNDAARAIGADIHPPMGVLAHEVQAICPEAVTVGEHGYSLVDYRMIGI